jgi:hypothetical protein
LIASTKAAFQEQLFRAFSRVSEFLTNLTLNENSQNERIGFAGFCGEWQENGDKLQWLRGIYERKGKNGDITYYIRYQFKRKSAEGIETIKDIKEKVGRKSRGCTREMAKEALRAREGEIAQGRFSLERVRKPHPVSELIERYHKHAESYKASYSRERYALEGFKRYFSRRYLADLSPWVIEKWKRERNKKVEKSTVNRS